MLNKDYKIHRLVDDFYIYTQKKDDEEIILEVISSRLNKFQLFLNQGKIQRLNSETPINSWVFKVEGIIKKLMQQFEFYQEKSKDENNDEDDKLKVKQINLNKLQQEILLIIQETNEKVLVSSYIFSTLLKFIEMNKNIKIDSKYLEPILNLATFLYVQNVSYDSTQKIIRLYTLIINIQPEYMKENISWNIERYREAIFGNFTNDWIDILLFISTYNIQLNTSTHEYIFNNLDFRDNPVNLAVKLINLSSKGKLPKNEVEKIDKIIKEKISLINWQCFFEDPNSWWVLIFYSFPHLKKDTKDILNIKLKSIIGIEGDEDISYEDNDSAILLANKFIIKFILDKNAHFIEWDFATDKYLEKYFFYTKNRMLFNPGNIVDFDISR
ncbi:hypothetical protein MHB48_06150 [Psychrobacillus sp. FSL H8-0483]|uniref:hypothetical protein n=1 Tax=Psychrobacillus sp. FSL H8-0483 TaxID=2921389 RepID=UPI003159A3F2